MFSETDVLLQLRSNLLLHPIEEHPCWNSSAASSYKWLRQNKKQSTYREIFSSQQALSNVPRPSDLQIPGIKPGKSLESLSSATLNRISLFVFADALLCIPVWVDSQRGMRLLYHDTTATSTSEGFQRQLLRFPLHELLNIRVRVEQLGSPKKKSAKAHEKQNITFEDMIDQQKQEYTHLPVPPSGQKCSLLLDFPCVHSVIPKHLLYSYRKHTTATFELELSDVTELIPLLNTLHYLTPFAKLAVEDPRWNPVSSLHAFQLFEAKLLPFNFHVEEHEVSTTEPSSPLDQQQTKASANQSNNEEEDILRLHEESMNRFLQIFPFFSQQLTDIFRVDPIFLAPVVSSGHRAPTGEGGDTSASQSPLILSPKQHPYGFFHIDTVLIGALVSFHSHLNKIFELNLYHPSPAKLGGGEVDPSLWSPFYILSKDLLEGYCPSGIHAYIERCFRLDDQMENEEKIVEEQAEAEESSPSKGMEPAEEEDVDNQKAANSEEKEEEAVEVINWENCIIPEFIVGVIRSVKIVFTNKRLIECQEQNVFVSRSLKSIDMIHVARDAPFTLRLIMCENEQSEGDSSSFLSPSTVVLCPKCVYEQSISAPLVFQSWLSLVGLITPINMVLSPQRGGTTPSKTRTYSCALLTLQVLRRLHKQFASIDTSGDGLIDEEELLRALGSLFSVPSFTSNFFRAFDVNGDGTISFSEFTTGLVDILYSDTLGKIRFTFRMFDLDHDGEISRDELFHIFSSMRSTGDIHVSDEQLHSTCADLFTAIDKDQSGFITFTEYRQAVLTDVAVYDILASLGVQIQDQSSNVGSGANGDMQMSEALNRIVFLGDPDWTLITSVMQALMTGISNSMNHNEENSATPVAMNVPKGNQHQDENGVPIGIQHLLDLHDAAKKGTSNTTGEKGPTSSVISPFQQHEVCSVNVPSSLLEESGIKCSKLAKTVLLPALTPEVTQKVDSSNVNLFVLADRVFAAVRSAVNLSIEEFRSSLGVDHVAANMLLGSNRCLTRVHLQKSNVKQKGSFCFLSHDANLLVKSLTETEVLNLLQFLPEYVEHVTRFPDSLLPRYLGIYCLAMQDKNSKTKKPSVCVLFGVQVNHCRCVRPLKSVFVVTGNPYRKTQAAPSPFSSYPTVDRALTQAHVESKEMIHSKHDTNYNLLDEADISQPFELAEDWSTAVHAMLEYDTMFLARHGLMNYSFIFGTESEYQPRIYSGTSNSITGGSGAPCASPGMTALPSREPIAAHNMNRITVPTSCWNRFFCCGGSVDNPTEDQVSSCLERVMKKSRVVKSRVKQGNIYSDEFATLLLSQQPVHLASQSISTRGMSSTFGHQPWWQQPMKESNFRVLQGGTPLVDDNHRMYLTLGSVFAEPPEDPEKANQYRQQILDYLRVIILSPEIVHGSSSTTLETSSKAEKRKLGATQIAFHAKRESGNCCILLVDTFTKILSVYRTLNAIHVFNDPGAKALLSFDLSATAGFSAVRQNKISDSRRTMMLRDILRLDRVQPDFTRLRYVIFDTERDADLFESVVTQLQQVTTSSLGPTLRLPATEHPFQAFRNALHHAGPSVSRLNVSSAFAPFVKPISICVASFHVGDIPPREVWPWLRASWDPTPVDLVVVATQACSYLSDTGIPNETHWFHIVDSALHGYTCIERISSRGWRLFFFASNNTASHVSNIEACSSMSEGDYQYVIKKSAGEQSVSDAVAISLQFYNTTFCFLNFDLYFSDESFAQTLSDVKSSSLSLTSGAQSVESFDKLSPTSKVQRYPNEFEKHQHYVRQTYALELRSKIAKVIHDMSLKMGSRGLSVLGEYHQIFWCGGVSAMPWQYFGITKESAYEAMDKLAQEVVQNVIKGKLDEVQSNDHFIQEVKRCNVFAEFQEPHRQFAPNYPYLAVDASKGLGSNYGPRKYQLDTEPFPYYRDHLLYKGLGHPLDSPRCEYYRNVDFLRNSSHVPMVARFETVARLPFVLSGPESEVSCARFCIQNLKAFNLPCLSKLGLANPRVTFHCRYARATGHSTVQSKTVDPDWQGETIEVPLEPVEPLQLFSEYLYIEVADPILHAPLGMAAFSLHHLHNVFENYLSNISSEQDVVERDGGETTQSSPSKLKGAPRISDAVNEGEEEGDFHRQKRKNRMDENELSLGVDTKLALRRYGALTGEISATVSLTVVKNASSNF